MLAALLLLSSGWAKAECTKDTDCKGDRICEKGVCVSPAPPAIPPPATVTPAPPAAANPPAPPAPSTPVAPASLPPSAAPSPTAAPPESHVTPPPPPRPNPALVRETLFDLDLRLEGFFGADGNVSGGGALLGVHVGASTWFANSPWALLYMGGAELGLLSSWGNVSVPASFSLELGGERLFSGDHRTGLILSLAWAPRLLYNFSGGELFSPYGVELALHISKLTIPLWFLETSDGTTLLGLGLSWRFL